MENSRSVEYTRKIGILYSLIDTRIVLEILNSEYYKKGFLVPLIHTREAIEYLVKKGMESEISEYVYILSSSITETILKSVNITDIEEIECAIKDLEEDIKKRR